MKRKKWISEESWNLIESRGVAKENLDKTEPNNPEYFTKRAEYWSLDSEVRRCTRRDKREYFNSVADQAEKQLNSGNAGVTRYAYEGIREITGKRKRTYGMPVKSRDGTLLTKDADINNRWCEHFRTVLNRPPPEEQADITEAEVDLAVDISDIREEEVVRAIQHLKNHKAPGMDGIASEMIKAEEIMTPIMFTHLFRSIWHSNRNPADWKKDMIVKVPKKGDLRECGN